MPQNFLGSDREQVFLMPPDPRDWLPEGHLAWVVLGSVEQLDLAAFYASYRQDGWGRAAFEPQMMVALLLYAYARGERSSRGHRAQVRGGRRLAGDRRSSDARSRDDRAVPCASRGATGRLVH